MNNDDRVKNVNWKNENKNLGLFAAISAYVIWGLFPVFFQLIVAVSAPEILAHRIIWSVPFAAILLIFRKQWGEVAQALGTPKVRLMLAVAATFISVNWLMYTWAVTNERILEASLGYFINPLMYVVVGVFVLKEPMRQLQKLAVGIALIGVLTLTIWQGVFPWVSLTLAVSFTTYGYIRKTINVGALPGLFLEVLLLSPIAIVYLFWLVQRGTAAFAVAPGELTALLILLGPLTVIPLTLFAIAARRMPLTTLGFLQYIGPSLQFLVGIALGEAFTLMHAIAFGFIWLALAIFSLDAFRSNRPSVTA